MSPLVRPRYRVAVERRTYLTLLTPDHLLGRSDVLVVEASQEPEPPLEANDAVWADTLLGNHRLRP